MGPVSGEDGGEFCIRADVLAVLAENGFKTAPIRLNQNGLDSRDNAGGDLTKSKLLGRIGIRGARTEHRGVDCEELGKGDVGEEREAAAGEEADAELLGLDLGGEAPHQPRRQPAVAAVAAARQLRRPGVRRRRHPRRMLYESGERAHGGGKGKSKKGGRGEGGRRSSC